jgi:hypothetical protein
VICAWRAGDGWNAISESDSRPIGVLLVLAASQLVEWGTIGLPAIVRRDLAADLGMSLPAVFAGTWTLARK